MSYVILVEMLVFCNNHEHQVFLKSPFESVLFQLPEYRPIKSGFYCFIIFMLVLSQRDLCVTINSASLLNRTRVQYGIHVLSSPYLKASSPAEFVELQVKSFKDSKVIIPYVQ